MTELTEYEKQHLALALFGYAMRAGPPLSPVIENIAKKVGVVDELKKYGLEWMAEAKKGVDKNPAELN